MDARRPCYRGPIIPEDGIFITDKGIGKRSEAFHWLMLGYHVYDHEFREFTVRDLERNIDTNGIMDPMHVRGALWKTVPQRFWLASRGGRNGPEPAQPGLSMETSDYYDRGPPEIRLEGESFELARVECKSHQDGSSPPHSQSQFCPSTSSPMSPEKATNHFQSTTPLLADALGFPPIQPHELTKSRSMTSLSCKSLKSSSTRYRTNSFRIESNTASQDVSMPSEPQSEWRDLERTTKETGSEDRVLIERDLGKEKGRRARLDSFVTTRSSSNEGEVHSWWK